MRRFIGHLRPAKTTISLVFLMEAEIRQLKSFEDVQLRSILL